MKKKLCMHHFIEMNNPPAAEKLYTYNNCYSIYVDDNNYTSMPFKVLSQINDKLVYVLTVMSCIRDTNKKAQNELRLQLEHIIRSYDDCIYEIKWHYWNHQYQFGRIDAKNANRFRKFLCSIDPNEMNAMKEFIINPKYVIIISDNRGTFEIMRKLGMFNTANIHKLDLEDEE